MERASLGLSYELIRFDYDDFRDVRGDAPVGEESLFGFDAHVVQTMVSVWF